MAGWIVKHSVEDHGELALKLATIRHDPKAYTTKRAEAKRMKDSKDYVYMVEVIKSQGGKKTNYRLAYKFEVGNFFTRSTPYMGDLDVEIVGEYGKVRGCYFEQTIDIDETSPEYAYLLSLGRGMEKGKEAHIKAFDRIFADRKNNAKEYDWA